jgi:hypothetical protein
MIVNDAERNLWGKPAASSTARHIVRDKPVSVTAADGWTDLSLRLAKFPPEDVDRHQRRGGNLDVYY